MFRALRALIDAWCDRRALHALNGILWGYFGVTGFTESWYHLRAAIQRARLSGEISREEDEILHAAIAFIDRGLTVGMARKENEELSK